jgi:rod shape-determining protein MreC
VNPVVDLKRRTGLMVLAVVLGHLTLISAQVATKAGPTVLEALVFGAFAEVQRAASWVVGGVGGVLHRYVTLHGVEAENVRLRRELDVLALRVQQERALADRGRRLALLLDMREAIDVPTIAADVIGGDASAWFQTVTINRGRRDGVRADMAVLAAAGVVGRVAGEPAPRAARVQLLIDRNAGAGAVLGRGRTGGVVVGDGEGLRMDFVSNLADVRVGDVVETSGLDGIFPKGFVIGLVATVERGTGLYRRIRVQPSVDFSAIEEVLVVNMPPASPEGARP